VTNKHVIAALGLSGSKFARAKNGAHLAEKYKEVSPEVKKMLECQDVMQGGSNALLKFLQTWDKTHNNPPMGPCGSNLAPPSP